MITNSAKVQLSNDAILAEGRQFLGRQAKLLAKDEVIVFPQPARIAGLEFVIPHSERGSYQLDRTKVWMLDGDKTTPLAQVRIRIEVIGVT